MRGGTINYYQVLGVDETATLDEIKVRYRQLSKRYHPDTPGGDEQRMAHINEAYAVLSDPIKRHFYKPQAATRPDAWDEKPIWKQPTHTAQNTHEPEIVEHNNGWAIFFAYVLAIPIAILLVTILTPIANRFFTRVTNNAVVQPGNVTATTPITPQPQTSNTNQREQPNIRTERTYYR